jgi:hypothetical protein
MYLSAMVAAALPAASDGVVGRRGEQTVFVCGGDLSFS